MTGVQTCALPIFPVTIDTEWQRRSELFDYAKEDANNDIEFNRVLWHGIKGDIPFPGPRRAAFVLPTKSE